MADDTTTIDTTSTAYQTARTNLAALEAGLRANYKAFPKLTPDEKMDWIARDDLLREVLEFSIFVTKQVGDI